MILALILFALLLLGLAAMLAPLRRSALPDVQDSAREALQEDYDASLAALRELEGARERGEVEEAAAGREVLRLQHRAARSLAALDALPPARSKTPRAPFLPAALGLSVLGAALLVGAYSVLPRWQLAGLPAGDALALQTAVKLPALARRAAHGGEQDQLALGRAAFDAGRYGQAVDAYTAVLKKDRRQPEALRRVGILLLQQVQGGQQDGGQVERARQAYALIDTAAKLAPQSDEGQLFLGFALSRFGDENGAARALERYQQLNPQGRDADELLATLRAKQGSGDPGLAAYLRLNCASCHGEAGGGGVGPSLRNSRLSRAAMRSVIRGGAAGMPAYGPDRLPDGELNALLDLLVKWAAGSGR